MPENFYRLHYNRLFSPWYLSHNRLTNNQTYKLTSDEPKDEPRWRHIWTQRWTQHFQMNNLYVNEVPNTHYDLRISSTTHSMLRSLCLCFALFDYLWMEEGQHWKFVVMTWHSHCTVKLSLHLLEKTQFTQLSLSLDPHPQQCMDPNGVVLWLPSSTIVPPLDRNVA